jgi:hypothetical protein
MWRYKGRNNFCRALKDRDFSKASYGGGVIPSQESYRQ